MPIELNARMHSGIRTGQWSKHLSTDPISTTFYSMPPLSNSLVCALVYSPKVRGSKTNTGILHRIVNIKGENIWASAL